MKRLTYISVAEMELTQAAGYYDAQQSGLGKAFLDSVRDAEEHIRQHPARWAFYRKPVRSYRVSPFPYRLLYRELSDRIQIIAVAHLSRRPDYWKKRLG